MTTARKRPASSRSTSRPRRARAMMNGNATTTATGAATGAEGACASEIRSRRATEAARNTTRGRLAACGPTGRARRCQIKIRRSRELISLGLMWPTTTGRPRRASRSASSARSTAAVAAAEARARGAVVAAGSEKAPRSRRDIAVVRVSTLAALRGIEEMVPTTWTVLRTASFSQLALISTPSTLRISPNSQRVAFETFGSRRRRR